MKRSCGLCCLLLQLGLAVAAKAQVQDTGSVTGVVRNIISDQPITEAIVSVNETAAYSKTNSEGRFILQNVPRGSVTITAKAIGYHPTTTGYDIRFTGGTEEIAILMEPLAYPLEALEVSGKRIPSATSTLNSTVLTKEELPAHGNILDALAGFVPGVRSVGQHGDKRLVIRGNNADAIYVLDGVIIKPPLFFYVDAADVECVEIRRGTQAAQEFRASITDPLYGGVVLIWTQGSYYPPRPKQCSS
ncbi:MAG: hypothetical protein A2939_02125 [Parcubacteria group bacterium RIFCSPLOWO2_01_FULL_48_18]|nr:MAG: hypothetical protein A3J67_00130 [Parcubacteria group bacterium RIFCSPHIGHO2_02_FULL_48_10b]OHB22688.1 MAG: hypothetical protein A2939_02125 [Parcubacteria group bacterium RIFCSPLOWO2_01_FULL_48_18]